MEKKEQVQRLVRRYCMWQVLELSVLIIGTAVVQMMFFPEVRLHAKALCLLAVFFFFTGVFRFFLCVSVLNRKRAYLRPYGWLRLLLCVALTTLYVSSPLGIGWAFAVQVALFYIVQLFLESWLDRTSGIA